jgi:DNA repair protein RadC
MAKQMNLFDLKIPEIEIQVKMKGAKNSELKTLTTSEDTYEVLKLCFNNYKINWIEEVVMLCLNKSNKVIGFYKLSTGGVSQSVVDPKIVFTVALNVPGTCAIILAHNHPSGNLKPSEQDLSITNKIKEAGKLIDIKLLDHLILTDESYTSFTDEGLI